MPDSSQKVVVSVTEMARMCNLSRPHLHALIRKGIMPQPVYCIITKRPFFTRDLQSQCLAVKQTNVGVDGRYVCFYAPRQRDSVEPRSRRMPTAVVGHSELREGLQSLGLPAVTDVQISEAVAACFPTGTEGVDEGSLLRTVWQHLRRLN